MSSIQPQTLQDLASNQHIADCLAASNVNLETGFATNYLNHYVEILLLLEMLPDMIECFEDIRRWRPLSYRSHVIISNLPNNDLILMAYDAADEERRQHLAAVAKKADEGLDTLIARAGVAVDKNDYQALKNIAAEAKSLLVPLFDRMSGIITSDDLDTTAFVDAAE